MPKLTEARQSPKYSVRVHYPVWFEGQADPLEPQKEPYKVTEDEGAALVASGRAEWVSAPKWVKTKEETTSLAKPKATPEAVLKSQERALAALAAKDAEMEYEELIEG